MANLLETEPVNLHVLGDKSGQTFMGAFSVLKRLTHRLELNKNRTYRELLGPNSADSDDDSKLRAEILSELSVAFTTVPAWWQECSGGLDIPDSNVIVKLYELVMGVRKQAIDDLNKKSTETVKELKAVAESDKVK
jgi:hypothetical protein